MALTTYNIYRNDTPSFTFTITDGDDAAYDLTGATVKFCARSSYQASTYQFEKSSTAGDATGIIVFTLTATDTNTAGLFKAEVQITKAGAIVTATQFNLRIKRDVVR